MDMPWCKALMLRFGGGCFIFLFVIVLVVCVCVHACTQKDESCD